MPDFSQRSSQKEILDQEGIPFFEIERNMKELEVINTLLGGHRVTLSGLKNFSDVLDAKRSAGEPVRICEIGCGGGDNLKAINKYCASRNIKAELTGIDINDDCIAFAKKNCSELNAEWITSNYRDVVFKKVPDIIFSSLFSHHFTIAELKEQYKWMHDHSKEGFFINDLHRHPLAYYSIKALTSLFSRSKLVKNDAPISVLRGFVRKDLEPLVQQYHGQPAQVKWKWAFRWLVVVRKTLPDARH